MLHTDCFILPLDQDNSELFILFINFFFNFINFYIGRIQSQATDCVEFSLFHLVS